MSKCVRHILSRFDPSGVDVGPTPDVCLTQGGGTHTHVVTVDAMQGSQPEVATPTSCLEEQEQEQSIGCRGNEVQ
jgi:hypothetical protein